MRPLAHNSRVYEDKDFSRVVTLRHRGTIVAIAEATDENAGDSEPALWCNILDLRQQTTAREEEARGERPALPDAPAWDDSQYWTGFQRLVLPGEVRLAGMNLLTFTSKAAPQSLGNWSALSDGSCVYVFRSVDQRIYASRYVMIDAAAGESGEAARPSGTGEGGPSLRLQPKTEARYRRSHMKDTPLNVKDNPSYKDMDGNPFTEPTIDFHRLLKPLQDFFAVCLAPSAIPGRQRWQFFLAADHASNLQSVSFLRSEDGWVDLANDHEPRSFTVVCTGAPEETWSLASPPAVMLYRPQERDGEEPHKLPTAPRILFAATMIGPVEEGGTAEPRGVAVDFPLQTESDGTPLMPSDPFGSSKLLAPRILKSGEAEPQTTRAWEHLSNGMGVLDWVSSLETPGLLDSADGRVHLYTRTMTVRDGVKSLVLDGKRQCVESNGSVNWSLNPGTIEAWIKPDWKAEEGVPEEQRVIFYAGGSGSITLSGDYSTLSVWKVNTLLDQWKPSPPLESGVWHHVAVTVSKDGDNQETATLYVGGLPQPRPEGAPQKGFSFYGAGYPCRIGAGQIQEGSSQLETHKPFKGEVQEVRVWEEARSQSQILSGMFCELRGLAKLKALVGYWRFGQEDGESFPKRVQSTRESRFVGYSSTGPDLSNDVVPIRRPHYMAASDYDTTSTRTQFEMSWKAGTQSGTLLLRAKEFGARMNGGTVTLKEDADPSRLELTIQVGTDTETWVGLPPNQNDVAAIINGRAADDPRDVGVQNGATPFYDYRSKHAVCRLATGQDEDILLVGQENALLRVSDVAVSNAGSNDHAKITVRLDAHCGGSTSPSWTVHAHYDHVPRNPVQLIGALLGRAPAAATGGPTAKLSYSATATANAADPVHVLQLHVGKRCVDLVCAKSSKINKVTVEEEQHGSPDHCKVTILAGDGTSLAWSKVPRDAAVFVRVLNGTDEQYSYGTLRQGQENLRSDFVAVGANLQQPVPNQTRTPTTSTASRESLLELSVLFSLVRNGATGKLKNTSGTNGPLSQGVSPIPPEAAEDVSSSYVQATPGTQPTNGGVPLLQPGKAKVVRAGSSGSWGPGAAPAAGSFTGSVAASCALEENSSLECKGDLTLEAWVRPDSKSAKGSTRSVITARPGGGAHDGYMLALECTEKGKNAVRTGVGERIVQTTSSELLSPGWNHLAAVWSGCSTLKFDGRQFGVCAESQGLNPGTEFSIDGILLTDLKGQSAGKTYVFSQSDGTRTSFELGIDEHSKLFLTVWFDVNGADASSRTATTEVALTTNKAYYMAAGCQISDKSKASGAKKSKKSKKVSSKSKTSRDAVAITSDVTLFVQAYALDTLAIEAKGTQSATEPEGCTVRDTGAAPAVLGCRSASVRNRSGYFKGQIAMLRFWDRSIEDDAPVLAKSVGVPPDVKGPIANWPIDAGSGKRAFDSAGTHDVTLSEAGMWSHASAAAQVVLYVNGSRVSSLDPVVWKDKTYGCSQYAGLGARVIAVAANGTPTYDNALGGFLRELRIWNAARNQEAIQAMMFSGLRGSEEHLVGYWPVSAGSGSTLKDGAGHGNDAGISQSAGFWRNDWATKGPPLNSTTSKPAAPPVGLDSPILVPSRSKVVSDWSVASRVPSAVEYGDLHSDSAGMLHGVMKRCYAYVDHASTAPGANGRCVLVTGFQVGELDMHYVGQVQTRPQLHGYIEGAPPLPSENMTMPYYGNSRSYQHYADASSVRLVEAEHTTFAYSADKDTGFDMAVAGRLGGLIGMHSEAGFGLVTEIVGVENKIGAALTFDHSLGFLRTAHLSEGTAKNISSALAARGDWEPKADSPVQRKLGRRYVPENVGYALVKSRVANLYALRTRGSGALISMILQPDPQVPEDFNVIVFPIDPRYTKQGTLDGKVGLFCDSDYPDADVQRGSYYKPVEAYDLIAQIEAEEARLEADYEEFDAGRRGSRFGGSHFQDEDPVRNPQATVGYGPQDRAEWRTRRRRRNLVNSYVWTATGGLFAEEEQTAITRQESAGGSYGFTGQAGMTTDLSFTVLGAGLYFDASALFGGHIHSSVTKSKEEGGSFGLEVKVDAEGFLGGKYDEAQESYSGDVPGKVTAYRFKTFYLAPDKRSFDAFFEQVVDQNWLMTSDAPEAAALRLARGNENLAWRVLHRVTFVSRVPPGYDALPTVEAAEPVRTVVDETGNHELIEQVADLVKKNTSSTMVQKIGQAVGQLLDKDIGKWSKVWNNFLKEGKQKNSAESTQLERVREAVFSYMKALGVQLTDRKW